MGENFKKLRKRIQSTQMRYVRNMAFNLRMGLIWMVRACIVGLAVGAVSSVFALGLKRVTSLRELYPFLLFLLPAGGLLIVWLYRRCGMERDKGTNLLLNAVQNGEEDVPFYMAPLIFAATLITHLFGGSAGREGAALQIGGSLGNSIGKLFRMKEDDRKIMVMSGMSAAFSAVFGTPLSAAIFPMEMASVGIIQYAALVPCVFASLVANQFALTLGVRPEVFHVTGIPPISIESCAKFILLGVLCGALSVVFCLFLRSAGYVYNRFFKNPYVKVLVGGALVIVLTLLVGSFDYNGAGFNLIEQAIKGGSVPAYSFLLKMLFTAVTLAAGYKGGEIVPAFCTGALFGCLFGNLLGISPSFCAALGMVAVFCGVTNCPIASVLIGFELFGFEGAIYILLVISVSYLFSGYRGLYGGQRIVFSKYRPKYINRSAGEEEEFDGADYED